MATQTSAAETQNRQTETSQTTGNQTNQTTASQKSETATTAAASQTNDVDLSKYAVGSVVTLKHGDKTLQVKIKEEAFIPDFAKLLGDIAVDHAREVYLFTENVFHKVHNSEYALRNLFANLRDKEFNDTKKESAQ